MRDVPRVSDCCGPCGRWCLVGVSGVEVLEVEDVNCRGRGWVWDLWVMLFPDQLQLEPEGRDSTFTFTFTFYSNTKGQSLGLSKNFTF